MKLRTFARLAGAALIIVAASLASVRLYHRYHRSYERARVIVSILNEQSNAFTRIPSSLSPSQAAQGGALSDNDRPLQSWIIVEAKRSGDPVAMIAGIRKISLEHSLSPNLAVSISRWTEFLQRWSEANSNESPMTADQMMTEGRIRFFEAEGYATIGKQFDATPMYLWSSSILKKFIENYPYSNDLPEALYLIGLADLHLGGGVPSDFRRERILNLCAELYPDSIWGGLADSAWRNSRNELGNET